MIKNAESLESMESLWRATAAGHEGVHSDLPAQRQGGGATSFWTSVSFSENRGHSLEDVTCCGVWSVLATAWVRVDWVDRRSLWGIHRLSKEAFQRANSRDLPRQEHRPGYISLYRTISSESIHHPL